MARMQAAPPRPVSFRPAGQAPLFNAFLLCFWIGIALLCWQIVEHHGGIGAIPSAALGIGILGLWRYGWALCHWCRATYYIRCYFPKLRDAANRLHRRPCPPLYAVVPSYQMSPAIVAACFRALFQEACRYPGPVTLIASVTTVAEQEQLEQWYQEFHGAAHDVRLFLQLQTGEGKRAALAEGLRAIARDVPEQDALVLLMDGDTIVPPHTLERTTRLFQVCPWLGAACCDNKAASTTPLLKEWYALRLAQRHMLMASLALSHRLLVLTGRFTLVRAGYAVQRGFVQQIEEDSAPHWRYGTLPLLTGDDKSTWFWLLKKKATMLYIPDVAVWSLETPCAPTFLTHTTTLMRRWYGNMLRSNGRALALGFKKMPWFVWWSLLDQRISMWTALTAPAAVGLLSVVQQTPIHAAAYGLWVCGTRLLMGLGLGVMRGRIAGSWPFLLYYTQMMGALVKIHSQFHLLQQRWSRQQTTVFSVSRRQYWLGHSLEFTAVLTFVYWVALMVGIADAPHF